MSTRITFIGHATVEIESGGDSLFTDPIFSERIFWIRRRIPLPMDPGSIKQPTALLISHAHFDHLDIPTLKYFRTNVPLILPKGLSSLLKKIVPNPLIELSHGATHQLTPDISITAFPVTHHGFRILPFRFNTCNGYLINMKGRRIFFPGDTAYRGDFARLTDQPIHAALLPIASYQPEWIMKGRHMNPEEAVRTFIEMKAEHMIPIHWGTFKLTTEPMNEPVEWLQRLIAEQQLANRVHILQPGESFELT